MFERFTDQAGAVVVEAQQQARSLGDSEIRAEHVLLALLTASASTNAALDADRDTHVQALQAAPRNERETAALSDVEALRAIGVDLDEVRRRAEDAFGPGALDQPVRRRRSLLRRYDVSTGGHLPFARPAKQALAASVRAAVELGDTCIGADHLLLGLLADDAAAVPELLRRLGVDPAGVRAEVTARSRAA